MADIFISYLHEDIDAAEKVADALEYEGWSVFWDRRILPGKRFDDFLWEQIQAAHCVIVLWSRQSIHSHWVRDEAREGLKKGILVPALLDDILPPFGFGAIQAANLIGWKADRRHWGFQQLLQAVRAAIKVPVTAELAGVGELSPRVSEPQAAEAKRRAEEEERQRREQQAAEAKRRAEEERQRRERDAAEAKRRAEEEERQRREQEAAEAKRRAEEERQRREQQAAEAKRRARGGATPTREARDRSQTANRRRGMGSVADKGGCATKTRTKECVEIANQKNPSRFHHALFTICDRRRHRHRKAGKRP